MNPKIMILVFALSLTIVVGAHGPTPAQATESQPGVAEFEIDTDTCTTLTGAHDPATVGPAFEPVVLWVDANSDGFYGNSSDYSLGSGMTDLYGDFSISLTPGYDGTVGLQIGGAQPETRKREICWWIEVINDWECMWL